MLRVGECQHRRVVFSAYLCVAAVGTPLVIATLYHLSVRWEENKSKKKSSRIAKKLVGEANKFGLKLGFSD